MTNTLGTFFGAGVVAEGTGLVLSNGMDWFDIDMNIWTGEQPGSLVMQPGKRNRWTLAPGMLFKDGKLFMVVGGAGAEIDDVGHRAADRQRDRLRDGAAGGARTRRASATATSITIPAAPRRGSSRA